jgi:hypothetical protein
MAKAGLYALGFVLFGVHHWRQLILWGLHTRPARTPSGPNVVSDEDTADVTARFRLAYDVAIRRRDVCERCGKAPVSKALRIKYPIVGAIDAPSNLLAVCDACYSAARCKVSLSRMTEGLPTARATAQPGRLGDGPPWRQGQQPRSPPHSICAVDRFANVRASVVAG